MPGITVTLSNTNFGVPPQRPQRVRLYTVIETTHKPTQSILLSEIRDRVAHTFDKCNRQMVKEHQLARRSASTLKSLVFR